jgi:hypothetical protein
MAFTKTNWVDGTTPISAAELNRIEAGIEDAHAGSVDAGFREAIGVYAGRVNSDGTAEDLPSGWTSTRTGEGQYTITHNLGGAIQATLAVAASAAAHFVTRSGGSNNIVSFRVWNDNGNLEDRGFVFLIVAL